MDCTSDETQHARLQALLFARNCPDQELDQAHAEAVFGAAVEDLDVFVANALTNTTAELTKQHIRSLADGVLTDMGYRPMFGADAAGPPEADASAAPLEK
jgi:hypothetical protein